MIDCHQFPTLEIEDDGYQTYYPPKHHKVVVSTI